MDEQREGEFYYQQHPELVKPLNPETMLVRVMFFNNATELYRQLRLYQSRAIDKQLLSKRLSVMFAQYQAFTQILMTEIQRTKRSTRKGYLQIMQYWIAQFGQIPCRVVCCCGFWKNFSKHIKTIKMTSNQMNRLLKLIGIHNSKRSILPCLPITESTFKGVEHYLEKIEFTLYNSTETINDRIGELL